ncbi:MAG: glycosyltransferase family 2 protein [Patescibacteria group bacterium]
MTITAIILNYKNYKDVCACIASLENQVIPTNFNLQILIIDNNSEDGCTEKLQKKFPNHQFIFNKKNLGFSKGVNQGIDFCSKESDYFLLVNNDAELEKNCLGSLIESSANKYLTGPVIFYKNEPRLVWQGGGFFSKLKMNISVPDKNQTLFSKSLQEVDYLSGCILLIPKNLIESIGKFDEKFFFYGEDLDYCLRAKKYGLKVIYNPNAQSWHNIKRAAVSRTSPFVLENLAVSYQLIIKKHFPRLRIYGLLLFAFLYTPFRLYQVISGGNNWLNILSWIKGGLAGWRMKI